MRLVPAAQRVRHGDLPFAAPAVDADPRQFRLQRRNSAFECPGDIGLRHDIELRPVSLNLALPQFEPGARAAI